MTIEQILTEVQTRRPCALPSLYRYLKKLRIRPLGAAQRPQNYPDDTAARILKHLGYELVPVPVPPQPAAAPEEKPLGIPSMRELRAVKRAGRRGA